MQKPIFLLSFFFILSLFLCLASCTGLGKSNAESQQNSSTLVPKIESETKNMVDDEKQIADYIRNIFQDKNGHFWFGTNGYGVAHYNGDSIVYFSNVQGFNGQQVTGIAEDANQNIWFSTDQGVVKLEWLKNEDRDKQFINFTDEKYFGGKRFWSIFVDRKNNVWAGASVGIFKYDGEKWQPFELLYPLDMKGEFITKETSWSISEDKSGNIWFSTNGYGAVKYDGQSFAQYAEKDGLTDNSVDQILVDSKDNIWFATRYGGVSRFDGNTFTNFTANDSIGNNEVCAIFEDTKGNIWMSSEGYGVYRYDGISFTNYSQAQGLQVLAVQTIFEDKEGRIWVGGGGGLYRFTGDSFLNVTINGPWE